MTSNDWFNSLPLEAIEESLAQLPHTQRHRNRVFLHAEFGGAPSDSMPNSFTVSAGWPQSHDSIVRTNPRHDGGGMSLDAWPNARREEASVALPRDSQLAPESNPYTEIGSVYSDSWFQATPASETQTPSVDVPLNVLPPYSLPQETTLYEEPTSGGSDGWLVSAQPQGRWPSPHMGAQWSNERCSFEAPYLPLPIINSQPDWGRMPPAQGGQTTNSYAYNMVQHRERPHHSVCSRGNDHLMFPPAPHVQTSAWEYANSWSGLLAPNTSSHSVLGSSAGVPPPQDAPTNPLNLEPKLSIFQRRVETNRLSTVNPITVQQAPTVPIAHVPASSNAGELVQHSSSVSSSFQIQTQRSSYGSAFRGGRSTNPPLPPLPRGIRQTNTSLTVVRCSVQNCSVQRTVRSLRVHGFPVGFSSQLRYACSLSHFRSLVAAEFQLELTKDQTIRRSKEIHDLAKTYRVVPLCAQCPLERQVPSADFPGIIKLYRGMRICQDGSLACRSHTTSSLQRRVT